MERNRQISKPSDRMVWLPVSRRSETKPKDFAARRNLPGDKKHAEASTNHSPSDTNPPSEKQTSSERRRDKIAHSEAGSSSASRDEVGGRILRQGQDSSDLLAAWLQERYDVALNETLLYERAYHDLAEKHNTVEKKFSQLEEEYHDSSKKYEALEIKVSGLNSEIIAKEQKQKELLLQSDQLTTESNKIQEEHKSIVKEIEAQMTSSINNLNDLQKNIEEKYDIKIDLYKQIEKDKQDILKNQTKQSEFNKKIEKIKIINELSPQMIEIDKNMAKLEEDISSKNMFIQLMNTQKEKTRQEINTAIANIKLMAQPIEYLTEKKHEFEEFIKYYENDINPTSDVKYCRSMVKFLDNDINDYIHKRSCAKKNVRNLGDKINMINTSLENPLREKTGSEQSLQSLLEQKEKLKETIVNNANFDLTKNDELATFSEQLAVIREYSKNNKNVEYLTNELLKLNNQYQNLRDKVNKIEELEKDNRYKELEKERDIFDHKTHLNNRELTIMEYCLPSTTFQPFEKQNLYDKQNLESMQKMQEGICKKIKEFENMIQSKKDEIKYLSKQKQHINDQVFDLYERTDIDDEEKNSRLQEYIETWQKNLEKSRMRGKELLALGDKHEQCKLQLLSIRENIYDYQLKEIIRYQSESELASASFHTKKSELQTKIDAELTQIASQLETDVHNLQQTCHEKTLRLKSVQSELKALQKSMEQEIERQKLQNKLDQLNSQANTARSEIDTITQELKDDRQKLEKSSKELDAAEQEKLLLGTKIEHTKKELEAVDKEIKSVEDEWRVKYYEYIKAKNASMHLKNICEMTKVILKEAEKYKKVKNGYKQAENKYEQAKYEYKYIKNECILIENRYEQAEDKYINSKIEHIQTENKYIQAKYELINELRLFENMMQSPNSLPNGKDSFTEGQPLDRRLQQALEKVSTTCTKWSNAQTELSNARTELSNARTELSNARTELSNAWTEWSKAQTEWSKAQTEWSKAQTEWLNARIDISEAAITKAIPDDKDRIQMIEDKISALSRKNSRDQWITKRPWDGAGE